MSALETSAHVSQGELGAWRRALLRARDAAEPDRARTLDALEAALSRAEILALPAVEILGGSPSALTRLPGSGSTLEREHLESAHAVGVAEALRAVPGVLTFDGEGQGLRPSIGLRGMVPQNSRRALLLEDSLPLAYAPYGNNADTYHPPLSRIERIEVLKGSGQILYGPQTIGGVVNYVTRDAPAKPSALVQLTGGTDGFAQGALYAGGTFGGQGLGVDYARQELRGSREATYFDLQDLALRTSHPLGRAGTLALRVGYTRERDQLTGSGSNLAEWRLDPRANPFHNDVQQDDRVGAALVHRAALAGGVSLTTALYGAAQWWQAWRQANQPFDRPLDAASPACGGLAHLDTTCGNEGRVHRYFTGGIEPRLHLRRGEGLSAFELDVGARVHREAEDRRQLHGDSPSARDGRLLVDESRGVLAFAGFALARVRLSSLTVSAGARFESVDALRVDHGSRDASASATTRAWLPGMGLAWAAGTDTTLFVGLHRGFAPPRSVEALRPGSPSVDLAPELSWSYELGVRSAGDWGRVEATAFYFDFENETLPANIGTTGGADLVSAGPTQHAGLELGLTLALGAVAPALAPLSVELAYTWLAAARFGEGRRSELGDGRTLVAGHRLPYAPEHSVSAALVLRSSSGFRARGELVFTGPFFTDDLDTVETTPSGLQGRVGATALVNISFDVPLRGPRLRLFVAGKNITDTLYVATRVRGIWPGPGRRLFAGLRAEL